MQATLIWNDKWTRVIPLMELWTIYTIYGLTPILPSSVFIYPARCHTDMNCSQLTRTHICTNIYKLHVPYVSLPPVHTIWVSSLSLRGEAGLCRVNVNVLTPLPKIRARPALRGPLNSNPLLTVSTSVLATSVLLAAGYSVSREDFLVRGLRDSRAQATVLFLYLRLGRIQKSHSRGCLRAAQVVLWASKALFQ